MKNRIFCSILTGFWMFSAVSVAGQNCYVRLFDASGIEPTATQLAQLEAASCRLIDSLPTAFQTSFKVFDFGFYLHNEAMVGGYPAAFQQAIDSAQARSPYYLLFGKQTDKTGICTRFWVDLRLPDTAQFSCMMNLQREVYKRTVESRTEQIYNEQNKNPIFYYRAELAGINELRAIIVDIRLVVA